MKSTREVLKYMDCSRFGGSHLDFTLKGTWESAEKYLSDPCRRLVRDLACVAGAKRGGGGGREKGKREGSACSKSLCFCITPTNFLVIRLRLLSIKCRYTRHAENVTLTDLRNSLSYSDPEGTLGKIGTLIQP